MKKIKPIFSSIWSNKARIDVYFHEQPLEGKHESDRIQLILTPADGKPRGWIMNVADATDIIYGLSKAMGMAIEEGVPNRGD